MEGWKYVIMEFILLGDYFIGLMKIYFWKFIFEFIRVKDWSFIWKCY